MTTAQHAILFETVSDPQRAGFVRDLIDSVVMASSEAVEARLAARIRVAVSRLMALRGASTEDEFEATFDLIAHPRLVVEFLAIVEDPAFARLEAGMRARELWRPKAPTNPAAQEYADDILERIAVVVAHGPGQGRRRYDEMARAYTAFIALNLAAVDRHAWHPWMVGILWNAGRRAALEMAVQDGMPWEAATDLLVTKRDQALGQKPFDAAASDAARRMLGLH